MTLRQLYRTLVAPYRSFMGQYRRRMEAHYRDFVFWLHTTVIRALPQLDMDRWTVGLSNEPNRKEWVRLRLAALPKGHRILDAGAGEQQYRPFCDHLDYVAQDFDAYDGKGDGAGLHVTGWTYRQTDLVSDIVAIPAESASFDAILCTEVFEHIPDPIAAIKEFGRLLKPGGKLLLTAPVASLTHFAPYYFYTGFSRYFFQEHLTKHGFDIDEVTLNGGYFDFMAQEVRRLISVQETYKAPYDQKLQKALVANLMPYLQKCAESDQGSSELTCNGIFIVATKGAAS